MSRNKSPEQFEKDLRNKYGNRYTILTPYEDSKTKIYIQCNVCDNKFYITPNSILNSPICRKCSNLKLRKERVKTQEKFEKEIYEQVGNEYATLGKYESNHAKILMKHNVCNHEWEVEPNAFLNQGTRCPKCMAKVVGRKKALNTDIYKSRVKELVNADYEVVDEYINYHTKIKMKHHICDNIFKVTPSKFLHGSRCPHCNMSNGEALILEFLKRNNMRFEPQYWFDDCRHILPLPFDFAIFDDKNNLSLLIEYDGELHFEVARFISDVEVQKQKLMETQKRDTIKNKYCYDNNIALLRIPYWEFNNVSFILSSNLSKYMIEQKEMVKT